MDIIYDSKLSISSEVFSYFQTVLPPGYSTKITFYKTLSDDHFECLIRLAISTKENALQWLASFEELSLTSWRTYKTYPEDSARVIFKKDYRCIHNSAPKKKYVPRKTHTNCLAKIKITVKQQVKRLKRSQDKDLSTRPCEVMLRFIHNHKLEYVTAFRDRIPTEEVALAFRELFNVSHSPSSAWQSYIFYLETKYGEDYYKIAADKSVTPRQKWVCDLYYSIFKKEFEESAQDEMVTSLTIHVKEYNEKSGSTCATILSHEGNLIVCICDPFMKRIHETLPSSVEVMFVASIGHMDKNTSKVYFFLCPSIFGALPLGIVIIYSECVEVLSTAFEALIMLFPEGPFCGRNKPKIIITDDCAVERNVLVNCFPGSILLLSKFHVLQSAMRYFWNSKHKIATSDRQEIFSMFHRLSNTVDRDDFQTKYETALNNDLLKKYRIVRLYFLTMQPRKQLTTTENHTINYSETNFRELKNTIVKRTKAFNVVQLFSFLTVQLSDYYNRRLTGLLNDELTGYSQSKCFIPERKLKGFVYTKTGDVFIVKNVINSNEYCVDMDNNICSCPIGLQGIYCPHQAFVAKGEKLKSTDSINKIDKETKQLLRSLLSGKREVNSFQDEIDVTSAMEEDNVCSEQSELVMTSAIEEDDECIKQDELDMTSATEENNERCELEDLDIIGSIEEDNSSVGSEEIDFVMQEIDDMQHAKEYVKEVLKGIFSEFDALVESNPTEFLPALAKFSDSYHKCKSVSSKLSALNSFGRPLRPTHFAEKDGDSHKCKSVSSKLSALNYIGQPLRTTRLVKKDENLESRRTISDTSIAVKRKKVDICGERVQQSRRSLRTVISAEHCYGKMGNKIIPHSLNNCVENNINLN